MNLQFFNLLQTSQRDYFTFPDLQKITGMTATSLKVSINRWIKQGLLLRIRRGLYQLANKPVDKDKLANQLYYPSYISFETALARYGILSQIPYSITLATVKKSKKLILSGTEVEYSQLKSELYFGYTLENGLNIALPEKALLDQLYQVDRGKRTIEIGELDWRALDKNKLRQFASKFPASVHARLANFSKAMPKDS